MNFVNHSELEGFHATLSPSSSAWIRYSDDKLAAWFTNKMEAARGTALHQFAHDAIKLGIRQAGNGTTLATYINDAIRYKMTPEQVLFYSENCFGTADAIKFDERKKFLRIHDLKNGVTVAKMEQLCVYAALFCLEYGWKPMEIEIELRIYQNDEIEVYTPEVPEIHLIMDRIVTADHIMNEMRKGVTR